MGCGCRAPQLQVLALVLPHDPSLAEGFLTSAGAGLRHLQLVIKQDVPGRQLWDGFWRAMRAFPELAALQLVLRPVYGRDLGEQVISCQ